MNDHPTEAAAIAEITQKALTPVITVSQGIHILSHCQETRLKSLESLAAYPSRVRGTVQLATLNDLRTFLSQQSKSSDNTVIFANRDLLSFTAILDFHADSEEPRWMDYRATVTHKKSRQLLRWLEKDGKKQTQEEFALFLEENIEDIRDPAGAIVLTFAETLEATRTETFKSSIVTSTGEMKLAYSTERNGEQSTDLITEITLGIPLFHRGVGYKVPVKIFHRVLDGKLTFWFKLLHIEVIIDKAWEDDLTFVREQCCVDPIQATLLEGTAPAEVLPLPISN